MVKGCYFFLLAGLCFLLSWAVSADNLVDPTAPKQTHTQPPTSVQVEQELPQLQSILLQEKFRSAVINNQTYLVGEVVAGYRVASIQANYVLLLRNGKTTKLSMFNADFLK
ncbi:MSHA biogenesis protein MshK [Motilimonas cestriensis]|uniref:MSHA biogenesis protein MshK n=1 Tax=Motilimonas cestriensis TaxID=2742685 RepID=A0ABS8WAK4_9GAMM|nr:MSHA biogenesis protein MshK [Motilimonas cestriensis]MCE2596032.1 MSHA biogenesis protein MshK [Motilimonas cestriensis]